MRTSPVSSFVSVDMRHLRLPLIVLYESPSDYPGEFVARLFDVNAPTDVFIVRESQQELMVDIEMSCPHMYFLPRRPDDEPQILGTYI